MIDDALIKRAIKPLAPHLSDAEWEHLVLIAAYIRPPDSDWRLQALAAQRLLEQWRAGHTGSCACGLCQQTGEYVARFVARRPSGVDAPGPQGPQQRQPRQLALPGAEAPA